ncbi:MULTISPECIES: quinone oxidoreductase family protein [Sphingomonas]|uniref:quinone oxidoreductase family protein n=1 Tax=Sphingomonas TaxID=13687 RepID=UPI000DEFDB1E|nr:MULTISPECIES: quinone oxidoreductase [Sphingomonas]
MQATRAILRRTGGPEVIEWETVDLPAPGPGEVLVEHEAVGLNFIDVYHRNGIYPGELPSQLGMEAVGIVRAAGPDAPFKEGERVATFGPRKGAYATARVVPADQLVAVPEGISAEVAAAALLKGCTAEFLAERCGKVEAGQDVLVHAAAGGVGQLLVQWLHALGARVIGTVSTEAKADLARQAGAAEVIRYDHEDVAACVRELTAGKGAAVVFDGVGKDTWEASLAAVRRRGLIVSYGNASGPVTGVNLALLASHGSLFVTRPTLFDYYRDAEERRAGAERLWTMIREGKVRADIGARYPLTDAARAHADLEARKTTGSVLLIP